MPDIADFTVGVAEAAGGFKANKPLSMGKGWPKEGTNKSSWHSGLHSNWRSRHLTEGMPGPVKVG
ncbi:hypothetical protein TUM17382_04930 [Shewanella algae]|nr:hypothetical protein TUM17382_04930 [Shewanella algae]